MKNVEIERKWLIDRFPDEAPAVRVYMEQGYLTGEAEGVTVRIRKRVENGQSSCQLTLKGGGGLVRAEVELPLDEDQYAVLVPLLTTPLVRKELRTYPLPGGQILECSLVDEGEPTAFYYAEVEFESEATAAAFHPPAFLGREVTGEPGHSMAAYARRKAGARQQG